ncbi:hypothetical protein [Methanobrevibacter sp.]|uniref:hypothetical protein n=1 Tax=Methanobrevibacter sp. TaxID=66852 RepID=UPI00388E192C
MISNVSDVVGSAYVDVGNYTFSLPEGFVLESDKGNQVSIINYDTDMHIFIYSSSGNNETFANRIQAIENSSEYQLYSNGTVHCGDMEIPAAFYHKDSENRSTFFFTEDGNNFRFLIIGFDYNTQKEDVINIVSNLVESVRFNHKLSG